MSKLTPLKAVVFDLDGLLFNTEELYCHVDEELLRRRGAEWTPELMYAMMGRPPAVALQTMIQWHNLSDTVEQLRAESAEVFEAILDTQLAPMPGAAQLLDALQAGGIPKAIGTSSPRPFVIRVLSRFGFEASFDFILSEEDVTHGKPHPEVYLKAAERFGVEPAEMMVLEDSENGCLAAVRAGTFAVAVPNGYSRGQDFRGASLVADTLADPRVYQCLGL